MGVRKVRQILRVSGISVVHKVENGRQIDMMVEVSRCWEAENFGSEKKRKKNFGVVKEKFWICR
jgi:hypothetical protein